MVMPRIPRTAMVVNQMSMTGPNTRPTAPLPEKEQHDDRHRDRHDERVHRRGDRLRPLHRGEHRNRGRDHAVAEEQGDTEDPEAGEKELRPTRDPIADLSD